MLEVPAEFEGASSCVVVRRGAQWSAHFLRPSTKCTLRCFRVGFGDCLRRLVETSPADFTPVVLHGEVTSESASSFDYVPSSGPCAVPLQLFLPKVVYTASVIVCSGPVPNQENAIFSSLLNRPVLAGCFFELDRRQWTVVSVEQTSGYKGLALVSAATRVKVNVRPADPQAQLPMLFGIAKQRSTLMAFLSNAPSGSGVVLQGPSGCGVKSVLHDVLQALRLPAHRMDSLSSDDLRRSSSLVVLLLDDLDEWAGADETVLAMHRARIQRLLLDSGRATPVRLVGVCHQSISPVLTSLFSMCIRFDAPDAEARAQILARGRGCAIADCMNEAVELVGLNAHEVERIASNPGPRLVKGDAAWDMLGGLDKTKDALRRDLILPRRNRSAFDRFGLKPPRGVLLYGPPGCGKTSIVKALCAEGLMTFIYLDSASVISAYVGETEKAIRDAFAQARAKSPSLIFFDEVDAIGRSRALDGDNENSTRLLSTLLIEMDGFDAADDVCFIGATNLPHVLDPALVRPGRFDKPICVPLPCASERSSIMRTVLRDAAPQDDVLTQAAVLMEGWSSADVAGACREALLSGDVSKTLLNFAS